MIWRIKRPTVASSRKDALGDSVENSSSGDSQIAPSDFRKTALRLGRMVLDEWQLLIPGAFLIGVTTFATVLEPRVLGWVIDEGVVAKNEVALHRWVLWFFFLQCIRVSGSILQVFVFDRLGQRVMQRLRVGLYEHLQKAPISLYDKTPVGRIITRLTNDVSALAELCSAGFITVGGNFITLIGILISLFVLDPKLGLITAAIFPFLAGPSVYFSGLLREAYRDSRAKLSALNAFLAENILGMKIVQLFNREKAHQAKFNELNTQYAEAQTGSVKVFALFQPSITLASGFSTALVMIFGGWRVYEGDLAVGVLVAYFGYVQALYQPLREMAEKWNLFLSGMTAAERIFNLGEWPVEMKEVASQTSPARARGEIKFENVWFAYQGDEWVLRDFSWETQAGKTIGIVGHTGAGKSTITSLLLRFYEPQRGRILLDGVDIRSMPLQDLRRLFGVVQQEAFLFSGSVHDNLTLWKEPSGQGKVEVENTLKSLGRTRWLLKDEGRIDLDERGGNLSAGERQILSFARALGQEPSIWLLDEATANIDSDTEEKMSEIVKSAFSGKTALIVAHRLATISDADEILVLHRGQLLEKGKHTELMTQNGLYARLYRYQSSVQPFGATQSAEV